MTFAHPVPVIASTNFSAHNTPQLHGDKAALDEKSQKLQLQCMGQALIQLATHSVINPAADKLNSALDQYKAKPFHAPKVTALSNPFPSQVASLDPPSISHLKIGSKLNSVQTGELTPHQRGARSLWIAVAISASILAIGIILAVVCPPLAPLALTIGVLAALALLISGGLLIHHYSKRDLDNEATRQEIRQELQSKGFQSLIRSWSYDKLVGYDLLRLKFASLSQVDKEQAYDQVAHLFNQYHHAQSEGSKAQAAIGTECYQGLASERHEQAQAQEKMSQICREARHSISLTTGASSLAQQTAAMLQLTHPNLEVKSTLERIDGDLKTQVIVMEKEKKSRLANLFDQKVASYRHQIDNKTAQLHQMQTLFEGKIAAAYQAIAV